MTSPSLSDFQNDLTASMLNTQVSTEAFVAIALDEDFWLIDLMRLKEASVPPRIAKNMGAPNWVVGIANFKGEVWTVIDMRVLLKNEPTLNPRWGWVTLLQPQNDHQLALLWSEIVEIAPKEEYHAELGARSEQWCRAHWKDKNGQVWKELDVDQLVGSDGLISQWRTRMEAEKQIVERRDE